MTWKLGGRRQFHPGGSLAGLYVSFAPIAYYDNVQYSDLATFFRVWLAHLLPTEVNWAYDEAQSAVATKATDDDSSFMTVISGIFQECGRVLKRHTGRLVFTFHHWDPNAWAELTIGLKSAGFKLMNYYAVSSEHPVSVHINNLNAITHDAILALALDGNSPAERWPSLTRIDTRRSERFCQQCSAALGWLLESSHSSTEIRTIWKNLIAMRNNRSLPSKDRFVSALNTKLRARLAIKFD
ncbi:MAG TPA: hypothetical protein VJ793_09615 [Anaerolineae bacterium]|nr:hypothetical protein [Anaerolineae bacterium]